MHLLQRTSLRFEPNLTTARLPFQRQNDRPGYQGSFPGYCRCNLPGLCTPTCPPPSPGSQESCSFARSTNRLSRRPTAQEGSAAKSETRRRGALGLQTREEPAKQWVAQEEVLRRQAGDHRDHKLTSACHLHTRMCSGRSPFQSDRSGRIVRWRGRSRGSSCKQFALPPLGRSGRHFL
jgi:hypothetical protein